MRLHLDGFVNWLNESVGGSGPLPNLKAGDYGAAMSDSLNRHFAEDREKRGVRMSNLGKPAVVNALAKLGYAEPEPKGKLRLIFHIGDMFENFLEIMLQVYGIEIVHSQPTLELYGITGHADYIIKCPHCDALLILEAKTMSSNYCRQFTREQDDDRGYLTQLAMYQEATGLEGVWITFDKGSNTVNEIPANPGQMAASLDRAKRVLSRLEDVQTLDDVLTKFRPPPARPEIYRRAETGKYILPSSMSFSAFASALYKTTDGFNGYKKPTVYVDGYADTEHMKTELEFLVESGALSYHG